MRKLILRIALLLSAVFLLAGCSSTETPESSSSEKPVNIQVDSSPNPAVVGDVTFTLLITDESGSPIEGASIDVSVDHTDMTGMNMSGPATEQGEGKYAITANMSMSGNWKMTVYVRNDNLDYQEDINLMIQ